MQEVQGVCETARRGRSWDTSVYRRRNAVAAEGCLGLAEARRTVTPLVLEAGAIGPRPNKRRPEIARWPFKVDPRMCLLFLGWIASSCLKPTRRGTAWVWHMSPRWLFASRADLAELLGCSVRTVVRMVAELAELELVERQRCVEQVSSADSEETPSAYRPGPALLGWLRGAAPEFLTRGVVTRFHSSGGLPDPSEGQGKPTDSLRTRDTVSPGGCSDESPEELAGRPAAAEEPAVVRGEPPVEPVQVDQVEPAQSAQRLSRGTAAPPATAAETRPAAHQLPQAGPEALAAVAGADSWASPQEVAQWLAGLAGSGLPFAPQVGPPRARLDIERELAEHAARRGGGAS